MAEYIRSILVHIEVDTNKQTHSLYLDNAESLADAKTQAIEFLEGLEM